MRIYEDILPLDLIKYYAIPLDLDTRSALLYGY